MYNAVSYMADDLNLRSRSNLNVQPYLRSIDS